MSQPIQPPPQHPPYGQPPQPAPIRGKPAKPKRFGFLALIITALVSLGIGGAVGGAGDGTTTALPVPTVTTTATKTVEVGPDETAPTEEPEPEPEPTKASAGWTPRPKDFKIGIKVLQKECFGSAGCNITFRIVPDYIGKQAFPSEGNTEVTYEVTGGEDKLTNTFEIDSDGTAHFSEEESASTTSSSKKLVAKITEVDYNEFG